MSTFEIIGFIDAIILIGLISVWVASFFSEKFVSVSRNLAIGFCVALIFQVLVFK